MSKLFWPGWKQFHFVDNGHGKILMLHCLRADFEIIQKKSLLWLWLCGFSVAPQKIWKSHRFGPRFGSKLLHCNVTERIQSLVPVSYVLWSKKQAALTKLSYQKRAAQHSPIFVRYPDSHFTSFIKSFVKPRLLGISELYHVIYY